jgi:hypothetical protein
MHGMDLPITYQGCKEMRFELKRDWETPLTKFHKGHHNTAETWARLMNMSLNDFYTFILKDRKWFKEYARND